MKARPAALDSRTSGSASRYRFVVAALSVIALAPASPGAAQATLIDGLGGPLGLGTSCLGPNDDGSSTAIDLTPAFADGLSFFGTRHTEAYVNTNGSLTFAGPLATYRSSAFPVADQPMIAPYWADVDIRTSEVCAGEAEPSPETCHSPTDNGVWWFTEPGRLVVTWHRVGYYDCHTDKRMTFQLVLTEPELCALEDDFDVEFRYVTCEWATGDRGGGVMGFGGEEAQAGFDAGNSVDFVEIPGSRESGIHTLLCEESNVGEPGIWRFRVRTGGVVCPDAGESCDTGAEGVCAVGATECVAGSTSCAPVLEAGNESCNGLDDDCDGTTDEGDGLCVDGQRCLRGRCSAPCNEFGCPAGFGCSEVEGVCVDAECEGVSCPSGQRCVLGVCAGLCDGVRCPLGQSCRAGRCVDPCESADCGSCGVCAEGVCVDRCEITGCADGERCESGRCEPAACEGIACGDGEACVGGVCVDRCAEARCPVGEMCEGGRCVARAADADAGTPDEVDAGGSGGMRDAGTSTAMDGGGNRGDAGAPSSDGGCRVGRRALGPERWAWALVAVLFLRRGRRGASCP